MVERTGSIEKMSRFLESLIYFEDKQTRSRVAELTGAFDRVKAGLTVARRNLAEKDRLQSPRFNVFELIHAERNEVHTHSALLSELFDPGGRHGQGRLFLSSLLRWLRETKPAINIPEGLLQAEWQVTREKWINGGSVDIALESSDPTFVVAIENKIDAVEQPQQIRRYHEWASGRSRRNSVVVFLTLDGRKATSAEGAQHVPMSYRDLARILSGAQKRVGSAKVREDVGQYVATIGKLGGLRSMNEYEKRVVKLLTKPANLPFALEIAQMIGDVKVEVSRRFCAGLRDKLETCLKRQALGTDWAVMPLEHHGAEDFRITIESKRWTRAKGSVYFGVAYEYGFFAGLCSDSLNDTERKSVFRCRSTKEARADLEKRERMERSNETWPVSCYMEVVGKREFDDNTYKRFTASPRVVDEMAQRVGSFFDACRPHIEKLNTELAEQRRQRPTKK